MASYTINYGVTKIDYVTAHDLILSNQCVLLDVRRQDEYDSGYIPGAKLLCLDDINETTAKAVIPSKSTPIIIYCRTGRRTIETGEKLKKLGYYYILDMGGITNWPFEIVQSES